MSVILTIHLGERDSTYSAEGQQYVVPVGAHTLTAMLTTDPPRPEDLTNAIGLLVDHIADDVAREVSAAILADVVQLSGPGVATVVAVEVGGEAVVPFTLSREAAEEVFRTLVTEALPDRVRNPGLPANEATSVLGVCCAVVAVLRALQLRELTVVQEQH
ncbi:MAG: hypothetical protein Q7V57_17895 [Actinomycetota bacterium]|nr:hypothetical protein [Actinomycetota bacterium]